MNMPITNIVTPGDIIENGFAIFVASADEISNGDYDRFDASMIALNSAGKLAAGYVTIYFECDTQSRELYEIPEVVRYVKAMFARCPHLLYFMPIDTRPTIMMHLWLCLVDAEVASISDGVVRAGIRGREAAHAMLDRITNDACAYARKLGDKATAKKIAEAAATLGAF